MRSDWGFRWFWVMATPYLLLLLCNLDGVAWYFKPLLLPPLLAVVAGSRTLPNRGILLTALLFSWLGDVTLMFADNHRGYFIAGLLLFLCAHVCYIVLFLRMQTGKTRRSGTQLFIYLAVLAYLAVMLYVLFPVLGDLKIPVAVYAAVISCMLAVAFAGRGLWPKPMYRCIASGALCFVLSDSLLAFNKFYAPYPIASLLIMSTYLGAQYLIVKGVLHGDQTTDRTD